MVVLRKKACPREVIAVPSYYPSPTGRVSFEWRLGLVGIGVARRVYLGALTSITIFGISIKTNMLIKCHVSCHVSWPRTDRKQKNQS